MTYKLVVFDVSGTLRNGEGRLFDGLSDVLRQLHQQGVQLAVASSLSVGGIRRFLDDNGIEGLFCCIKSADQTEPKPHPAMLKQILLETAIEPHETIMIGDSPEDILMAKAAGIASIAALWRDGAEVHQFIDLRPDFVLQLVSELLNTLQQK